MPVANEARERYRADVDEGYVRKMETSFSASPEGVSGAVEASLVFELYDYGADVGIVPPPAADVADVSALGG